MIKNNILVYHRDYDKDLYTEIAKNTFKNYNHISLCEKKEFDQSGFSKKFYKNINSKKKNIDYLKMKLLR